MRIFLLVDMKSGEDGLSRRNAQGLDRPSTRVPFIKSPLRWREYASGGGGQGKTYSALAVKRKSNELKFV